MRDHDKFQPTRSPLEETGSAEHQLVESEGKQLRDRLQTMANIVQQHSEHSLLQFNDQRLEQLEQIDSIVVIGPSGAGKSTLVDVARDWVNLHGQSNFVVPRRVVSRPQRANDNLVENDFASTSEEFDQKTDGGISWERKMDLKADGRVERYGFGPSSEDAVPIYSANLAILSPQANLQRESPGFLNSALIVYIDAFPHIRSDRLEARSPDILRDKPEEAAMRLAGDKEGVMSQAHVTLRTRNVENERDLYAEVVRVMLGAVSQIRQKREV